LDPVADEVELPLESKFSKTKFIWNWLAFVYFDDDNTEKNLV